MSPLSAHTNARFFPLEVAVDNRLRHPAQRPSTRPRPNSMASRIGED